uniref:Uncharacterized protein n=1 Tax=Plectus sambesii TaxID=2011161 RepID=A0A914X1H9_9BILA
MRQQSACDWFFVEPRAVSNVESYAKRTIPFLDMWRAYAPREFIVVVSSYPTQISRPSCLVPQKINRGVSPITALLLRKELNGNTTAGSYSLTDSTTRSQT